MKRTIIYFFLLSAIVVLAVGCNGSTYKITEPKPTLEVTAMQDTYTLDDAAYLQLRITQQGYSGAFRLSAVIVEGNCELKAKGSAIATTGEWVQMPDATTILTIMPKQIGALRLSLEVKGAEGSQSGRSYVNFHVTESPQLKFEVAYPTTTQVGKPMLLSLTLSKKGFTGILPVKYEHIAGSGVLQYGSVTVPAAGVFSVPANGIQELYYTPSDRGTHKLQLSATDGYTTEFKNIEVIVTN